MFLFKWQSSEGSAGSVVQDDRLDKIFFAKQMIKNACATQAIISVLLNAQHPDVHVGPILREFKDFTASFDPAVRTEHFVLA